jgi:hypothetical protein
VLWTGRPGDPHADHPDPGLLDIRASDVVSALDALERSNDSAPFAQRSAG